MKNVISSLHLRRSQDCWLKSLIGYDVSNLSDYQGYYIIIPPRNIELRSIIAHLVTSWPFGDLNQIELSKLAYCTDVIFFSLFYIYVHISIHLPYIFRNVALNTDSALDHINIFLHIVLPSCKSCKSLYSLQVVVFESTLR